MRESNLWDFDGGKRGRLAPEGAPGARRKQGVRPYLKSTLQT